RRHEPALDRAAAGPRPHPPRRGPEPRRAGAGRDAGRGRGVPGAADRGRAQPGVPRRRRPAGPRRPRGSPPIGRVPVSRGSASVGPMTDGDLAWRPTPKFILRNDCLQEAVASWTPGRFVEVGAGTGTLTRTFLER